MWRDMISSFRFMTYALIPVLPLTMAYTLTSHPHTDTHLHYLLQLYDCLGHTSDSPLVAEYSLPRHIGSHCLHNTWVAAPCMPRAPYPMPPWSRLLSGVPSPCSTTATGHDDLDESPRAALKMVQDVHAPPSACGRGPCRVVGGLDPSILRVQNRCVFV